MGDWVILFRKNLFSRPKLLSSKMIAIFWIYINNNYSLKWKWLTEAAKRRGTDTEVNNCFSIIILKP